MLKIYQDGEVFYISSAEDVQSGTIYTGCMRCGHMIRAGAGSCRRCGKEQNNGSALQEKLSQGANGQTEAGDGNQEREE